MCIHPDLLISSLQHKGFPRPANVWKISRKVEEGCRRPVSPARLSISRVREIAFSCSTCSSIPSQLFLPFVSIFPPSVQSISKVGFSLRFLLMFLKASDDRFDNFRSFRMGCFFCVWLTRLFLLPHLAKFSSFVISVLLFGYLGLVHFSTEKDNLVYGFNGEQIPWSRSGCICIFHLMDFCVMRLKTYAIDSKIRFCHISVEPCGPIPR